MPREYGHPKYRGPPGSPRRRHLSGKSILIRPLETKLVSCFRSVAVEGAFFAGYSDISIYLKTVLLPNYPSPLRSNYSPALFELLPLSVSLSPFLPLPSPLLLPSLPNTAFEPFHSAIRIRKPLPHAVLIDIVM